MKTVIGIDFGTLSARGILVNAEDGIIAGSHTVRYPHGIFPGDLVNPLDYDAAMEEILCTLLREGKPEELQAICVDATSFTLISLDAQGRHLSQNPKLSQNPHALCKLWKRHTAQPWAEKALRLAQETDQPFLRRTGGSVSSEWVLPKLLEIANEAPDVFAQTDLAFDLCDYLTYRLTGEVTRSKGSMSFKALWSDDLGFPPASYLDTLLEGFAAKYCHLLRGKGVAAGEKAGVLRAEICEKFGIRHPVVVAGGVLDGHTGLMALGALHAGDGVLIAGTSNVFTLQTDELHEIEGVCGVAQDGFVKGLCGIDAGQACTGDMLDWYIHNALPQSIQEEAAKKNMSAHAWLCAQIKEPWKADVFATDWFNGSRNTPCDLTLTGGWLGLTLQSRPEDLYLALLQSIVFGTKAILDECAANGAKVKRFLATGGMAQKNPLLMQLYADILQREVSVGALEEGPALGSAIYAALAAGLYANPQAAYEKMGIQQFSVYKPNPEHAEDYKKLTIKQERLRKMLMAFHAEKENET